MIQPTPPIEIAAGDGAPRAHFDGPVVEVPADIVDQLAEVCPTDTAVAATADASRDWWPISMHWALAGAVPQRAAVVVRPTDADQVAAIAAICHRAALPLTVAGGRSGVCGASIPLFGGVLVDVTALTGVVSVDVESGIVEVLPGTFGPDLEAAIAPMGLTVGHFPQSFDIATVGGWVACRGAGQYSTRYGKIEDIVVGLEVVLADGRIIRTGGGPAAAVGPDLTHVFLGSEGTLGIITRVWLRAHPTPATRRQTAYSVPDFATGIELLRQVLRRGATPAVLRLYDEKETARSHGGDGTTGVVLVLDEGDPLIVDATLAVIASVASGLAGVGELGPELVDRWLEHRNDTSALQALSRKGFVVDTMEVAAPWSRLNDVDAAIKAAISAVPHARSVSAHVSHSYADGASLYVTFAASPPPELVESTYVQLWDAGQPAALDAGAQLSHHHGVGLNRGRFMRQALGPGFEVLDALKSALDPHGILNPGKLGLSSPFGVSGGAFATAAPKASA